MFRFANLLQKDQTVRGTNRIDMRNGLDIRRIDMAIVVVVVVIVVIAVIVVIVVSALTKAPEKNEIHR